jgi:hypothetical protein
MKRLDRNRCWVLVTGTIAVLVVAVGIGYTTPSTRDGLTNRDLAHALGDDGLFHTIRCSTQRGSTGTDVYNRRCMRIDIDGLCYPGTGETRWAILVRVRSHSYRVVDTKIVSASPPCESVA